MTVAYLGINLRHDTSAALVLNGQLVAAIEQERFDHIRHSTSFPIDAIEYCIQKAGIRIQDLTKVAVTWRYNRFLFNIAPFEGNTIAHDDISMLGRLRQLRTNTLRYTYARTILRKYGFHEVVEFRHHLAHAAGAFFLSGYPEANIIVIDGRGERESTSLMVGRGSSIETLESYPITDSLGHVYTYVTWLCGLYTGLGQEGKTMGLAGHGKEQVSFDHIIRLGEHRYSVNRDAMRRLRPLKVPNGQITETAKNLAFGVQRSIEKAYVFLARSLYEQTGIRRFALSGGVALNCNANGMLIKEPFVDQLFIQPAANDAGTSIGAAMLLHAQETGTKPLAPESQCFLGSAYDDHAIELALEHNGKGFSRCKDIQSTAADLLARGKIIGWYQGAMEFGPRALGNRSILANPCIPGMNDRVNLIKRREPWRPLAPAVLLEHVSEWFSPGVESPYMLITLSVKDDCRKLIPAVTHADGTARVQTVSESDNPMFYALIRRFHEITGVPIVLNTSLNTKAKPIVRTPEEAIRCFYESGLDALVMSSYLLHKGSLD